MASSSLLAFATLVVGMIMVMQNSINAVSLEYALKKNGNFRDFIDKLNEHSLIDQIDRELNQTGTQLTVFAPTHKGMKNFSSSESWKDLTKQQKVSLLLYHMVPKYYQFSTIMKITNPIQTRASGSNGKPYTFNITANSMTEQNHQFTVSTGINNVKITYELPTEFPLQIFVVEEVLRPLDLFQDKNNTAPPPGPPAPPAPGEAPNCLTPPAPGAAEVLRAAKWSIGLVTMIALTLF